MPTASKTEQRNNSQLTATTFEHQLELAERLLNDPNVPLDPRKVWAAVEKLRQYTYADEPKVQSAKLFLRSAE